MSTSSTNTSTDKITPVVVTGFDHVTLITAELSRAVDDYCALLRASPTYRGGHPELGTRAAIFGFDNALLELTGPAPEAAEAEGMRAYLAEHGPSLQALAFASVDVSIVRDALREAGVRAAPPSDGTAHADDGSTRSYRSIELSPRSSRGVSLLLVERGDTERLRGQHDGDPSRPHAIDHIVLRTSDADAAIALYGRALGLGLALDRELLGTRMLFFRSGGVTLEVVVDASCGERDRLWGLAYRVRDLDAAHARLSAAGFTCSERRDGAKPGTRVFTVRDARALVPTLFVMDPSRA